jgi:anthranilate 1,2-dioxygenase large subunit
MSWARAISVSELQEKGCAGVLLNGLNVALFHLDGDYFATGNVCTHQFALLTDGHVEDGCVECPLHQGLFDIRTGKAQGSPVTKDIPTYAVKIEDDILYVDTDMPGQTVATTEPKAENITSTSSRIVIVGAGQAAGRAAEAMRDAGFNGTIQMIGDETSAPYERPPLSKAILTGAASADTCALFASDRMAALDIDLITNTRVDDIDRKARMLTLSGGTKITYDALLLATGARARPLPIEGAELEGVHYLRTLDDAMRLKAAMEKSQSLVIVGAGFIGLEVASSARQLGKTVTILEREERVMTRVLPEAASTILESRATANGVDIRLGVQLEKLSGTAGHVDTVHLANGDAIAADLVLVGIGAIPNIELAQKAGLTVRDGVIVDAQGRTSDAHIWAAGDVAQYPHARDDGPKRLESWHNAEEQGRCAGRSMAGLPTDYSALPWFWSDQFDGSIQVVGIPQSNNETVLRPGTNSEGPAVFCLDDKGHLTAVIGFDNPSAISLGRKVIPKQEPIDLSLLIGSPSQNDLEEQESEEMTISNRYRWPDAGAEAIPDWVYTDETIYEREVEKIFHGRTWNYVALEAEIPEPGDFVRSNVGPTPVVVVRGEHGAINVFENRCAHRAAEFCREQRGKATEFVCPYHQWTYDLEGNLSGVPFRRGVAGKGGMAKDFKPEEHGVKKLFVTTRRGVVFASFAEGMESIEDYMGPEILTDFDATFDGRKLKILGYYRNTLPGNWKLYHENLKDPYHATLLHTFLVTFGLLVAGNKSEMICDATGRHGTMASAKSDGKKIDEATRKEMRAYREGMGLNEPRFMDFIEEFDSPWSVTMQTIWPNLIVQREMNTLGVRQIVPQGPHSMIMNWTMFGYEGDDEEMTRHRLRQGNLMGPAGFLGLEDNEAIKFVQDGMKHSSGGDHLVALDPDTPTGTSDTLISESAIRGMYQYWRKEMGL